MLLDALEVLFNSLLKPRSSLLFFVESVLAVFGRTAALDVGLDVGLRMAKVNKVTNTHRYLIQKYLI